MPYRTPFANQEFYHIYNRGLEKQNIFLTTKDRSHFLETLFYYQLNDPKPKFSLYRQSKIFSINTNENLIDIVAYCLMPNHFHLLVKQRQENGISEFMRKFVHSYTKYRNVKYKRQGPLFQGVFKAKRVETDEQLVHLSRYIHLNPFVSGIIKDLDQYPWSSFPVYIGMIEDKSLAKDEILNFFKSPLDYKSFVLAQADYGETLERIKHIMIDEY